MANGGDQPESLPATVREIVTLVVDYVRQETLDPIKGLGRFVAFGLAAVVVGGLGLVLLILAGLRFLQAETGSTFTGHLSFLPYTFAFVLCILIAVGAIKARGGDRR